MLYVIFRILASLFMIYSLLCSIRIVMTWIPGVNNGFTNFLAKICDPYLNFFSRSGIFRFGAIDFSPVLSLGILALLSTIFSAFSRTGRITFGFVLALILEMAWNVISSIIGFLLIILIIRLVVLIFQNNSYSGSQFWRQFDYIVNPIIYRIISPFSKGKMIPYKTAIIISIVSLILVELAGGFFIFQLARLIKLIPF